MIYGVGGGGSSSMMTMAQMQQQDQSMASGLAGKSYGSDAYDDALWPNGRPDGSWHRSLQRIPGNAGQPDDRNSRWSTQWAEWPAWSWEIH